MIALSIINAIVAIVLIFIVIRLISAIKAFDGLIMKFVTVNQQFYENQKTVLSRTSDALKILSNETIDNKNMVAEIRRLAQDQSKHIRDTYSIIQKMNTDVKAYSAEVRKVTHHPFITKKENN